MSAYRVMGQALSDIGGGTLLTVDITVHLCASPERALASVTAEVLTPHQFTWIAPPEVREVPEDAAVAHLGNTVVILPNDTMEAI